MNSAGDIIQNLSEALLAEIKAETEETLVKDFLASIEPQVREKIKPIIESITIQSIEQFTDIMRLKQVLEVRVKVND